MESMADISASKFPDILIATFFRLLARTVVRYDHFSIVKFSPRKNAFLIFFARQNNTENSGLLTHRKFFQIRVVIDNYFKIGLRHGSCRHFESFQGPLEEM